MRTVTLQDYKRRLLRVLVHIQQHLDNALGLRELAGLAFFSPYHFHRIFKGMVGESVKELRSTPCFEVYLNDPQSTEPEDLITDICAPLQSKSKRRT